MTDNPRNPLHDPRAGDIVESFHGVRRLVTAVTLQDGSAFSFKARNITYSLANPGKDWGAERKCWISTWQDWCYVYKARVIEKADTP